MSEPYLGGKEQQEKKSEGQQTTLNTEKPGFWKSLVKAIRASKPEEGAEESSKAIEAVPVVGKAVMPREAVEQHRAKMKKIDTQLEEGSK